MNEQVLESARRLRAGFDEKLPIDIHAIAAAQGVTVREEVLEDSVSGMLVIRNGRAMIAVNRNHHPNRQRFSIAHELGHLERHGANSSLFIDAEGDQTYYRDERSSAGVIQEEREANAFAAELLMPSKKLVEKVKAIVGAAKISPNDEASVKQLAAVFGVSTQAMIVRLTALKLMLV